MNSKLRDKIFIAAEIIEIGLGIIILFACIASGIGIVFKTDISALISNPDYLQERLSDVCLIIIGIELIKMITSYTIDSVVDVMLLAVARQMIVEHTSPLENLFAVFSVGVLFVIRKYLYISQIDKRVKPEKGSISSVLKKREKTQTVQREDSKKEMEFEHK